MKIAVIDDKCNDINIIIKQLKLYFKTNYSNVPYQIFPFQEEAVFLHHFTRNTYDLIFIDYYLNNCTGLDLARQIRRTDPSVILIFITTTRDFAIDCYKVKASGYLVKPLVYDDFAAIMSLINCQKLREQQFIEIVSGYDAVKIFLRNIIYCDMAGHYAQIHTTAGIQKSRIPFFQLTEILNPYPEFLSCYRGCLINLNYVAELTDLTFIMTNGERIPFRKKEKSELLRIYSNFLFEKVRNHNL